MANYPEPWLDAGVPTDAPHPAAPAPTPAPPLQLPSIGRVVVYTLTEVDAVAINRRRADARHKEDWYRALKPGAQCHVGNMVHLGDEYPALVVKTWGTGPWQMFNVQVMLDGSDTLWVTLTGIHAMGRSVPGFCRWPSRV